MCVDMFMLICLGFCVSDCVWKCDVVVVLVFVPFELLLCVCVVVLA